MMKINNQEGRKYLSEVKRHLKCVAEKKAKFLEALELELHNFELDHPNASYEEYLATFGEPKTSAQKYMDELSDREVFGYWKPAIIAAVIAILAILALMIGYFFTHRKIDDIPVYYVSDGDTFISVTGQSAAAEE